MAMCPKGFWECPECGDFVEDTLHICYRCRYDKNTGLHAERVRTETLSSYTPSSTEQQTNGNTAEKSKQFSNIGTKIKEYALRLYIITIIVCIILGIVYARDLRGDFQFVLFLQYVVGGIGVGFFEYLLLLGFGTLIEDVGSIRNKMEQ